MTDALIAVAGALALRDAETGTGRYIGYWDDMARAALAAIESAGYRVVPVEPTTDMVREMVRNSGWRDDGDSIMSTGSARAAYAAMLAAAPKVTP